jgi:hypothetical protein
MDTLKVKKAWEVALGPIKSLPMTGIMMYMSGNSLQIFSIMMVFMAFKNPIMGILGTNQAFERFETDSNRAKIMQVKLAYVAMQLVALALGIWKVNGMGLLPSVCRALFENLWLTRNTGRRGRTGWPGKRSAKLWSTQCRRYRRREKMDATCLDTQLTPSGSATNGLARPEISADDKNHPMHTPARPTRGHSVRGRGGCRPQPCSAPRCRLA